MKKIIRIKQLEKIENNKKIVVVGGCFDILHLAHVIFLEKAKKQGELLIVLLESDKNIRKLKGKDRPINSQRNRAEILVNLKMVDWVVKLPEMKKNEDYINVLKKIKPAVIAVSEGDKNIEIKKREAKMIGAKLVRATRTIPFWSSTKMIEIMNEI